jgi:predicted tellurium resistance membrane protein TerC
MITIIISVLALTMMEVVLGIDNIIFIGLLANSLEDKKQANMARKAGLAIALIVRIIALIFIAELAHMTNPVFTIDIFGLNHPVSIRDMILFLGGLFLIHKSVSEIHGLFEQEEVEKPKARTVSNVIIQIVLIDLVFSADSILTAIGLVDEIEIMVVAVVLSMLMMFFLSSKISAFIDSKPSLKVLALAFLTTIGATLVMEGTGMHIDKMYIYFAMAFAGGIELLNSKISVTRASRPLKRKEQKPEDEENKSETE